jgi:hypothetical protein
MIYPTFRKRRAVKHFDTKAEVSPATIDLLLQKAWMVTPSKNNFMPYTIHVLGPEHQHYKKSVYLNCLSNEGRVDGTNTKQKYKNQAPFYSNILSCSYLLIFTMRLEDQPNLYQRDAMRRGCKFEWTSEETLNNGYPGASLEVGMFSDILGGLCLEKGLDVSSVLCFQRNLSTWTDLPFVNRKPILLMAIGKAKEYIFPQPTNRRPNFERIVNFVGLKTKTPTHVDFTPDTGILTFTVANHGLTTGSKIGIAAGSLSFTCAMDNHATIHSYPRITDPECNSILPIISTGADTFTVNVGISPNTSAHTFVSALPDSIILSC